MAGTPAPKGATDTRLASVLEGIGDAWFEDRVYPSADGLSVFFTELTDRKRAEPAMQQERDLSNAPLDSLPFRSMRSAAGSQFDPGIVEAFLALLARREAPPAAAG